MLSRCLFSALSGLLWMGSVLAQNRWDEMDYGPFLSSSVTMPWCVGGEDPAGMALKAVTIRSGTNGAICFDTATLRYAAVWTGGGLALYGTPFDGTHRPPEKSRPAVKGTVLFGTSTGPGVARQGDWRDPRPEPYVPLPRDWGRYRGLHLHGNDVVLDYSVGETRVLELPTLEIREGRPVFFRTMAIEPGTQPVSILVAETRRELRNHRAFDGTAPVSLGTGISVVPLGSLTAAGVGLTAGDRWEVLTGDRLVLHLQPGSVPRYVVVAVSDLAPPSLQTHLPGGTVEPSRSDRAGWPASDLLRRWLDPAGFRSAGQKIDFPLRFPEVIETQGRLGETGGPYEVDLLTAPETNPGKSWLRFGGFDFFAEGTRAAVCTWSGDVWLVSGIDDSLKSLRWQRFATGLFQPLGLKIVRDQVYVLGRDQITRLVDENGDGEADTYECFNNEVSVTPNFHEFALDLHTDPEGNFYFTKGAPLLGTEYWDPIGMHNGSVIRISADGRELKRYATGLRAPNGSGVGPRGEVTCSDNEGIWTPVCRLNWVRPGGFYGAMGLDHRSSPPATFDPPLCWLPFAVDNSSGGQVWTSDRFGPLSGQLIHLSYGKCRAFLVLREEVDGTVQGGVVPLPWKFESSAMRGRANTRDGHLYVCGLKGWQTTAARDGALHRIRYTGKPMPGLKGLRLLPRGVELTFNTPLDRAAALDPQNWNLQWWNYLWSRKYGSDLYSVKDPRKVTGKKGELRGDAVTVEQIQLSADGQTVTLALPELQPVMQWMIKASLKSATGEALPLEYYGTINATPSR